MHIMTKQNGYMDSLIMAKPFFDLLDFFFFFILFSFLLLPIVFHCLLAIIKAAGKSSNQAVHLHNVFLL